MEDTVMTGETYSGRRRREEGGEGRRDGNMTKPIDVTR